MVAGTWRQERGAQRRPHACTLRVAGHDDAQRAPLRRREDDALHETDRDDAVVLVVRGVAHPQGEELRALEGESGLDPGEVRQPPRDGLDRLLDPLRVERPHVDRG